jgi:hypothetical protein
MMPSRGVTLVVHHKTSPHAMPAKSEHPMATMTRTVLEDYVKPEGSNVISDKLLMLLECPWLDREQTPPCVLWPERIQAHRAAVEENLLVLFSALAGTEARARSQCYFGPLLCGMALAKCWRSLLLTEDGAYALATGLIGYIEDYYPEFKLDTAAAPYICLILNEWLKPVVEWVQPPSIGVLFEHMFGDVWPGLVLPDDHWKPLGNTCANQDIACDVMWQERPPFMPGLCLAQVAPPGVDLPADVGLGT